jgi:hypothetical protein
VSSPVGCCAHGAEGFSAARVRADLRPRLRGDPACQGAERARELDWPSLLGRTFATRIFDCACDRPPPGGGGLSAIYLAAVSGSVAALQRTPLARKSASTRVKASSRGPEEIAWGRSQSSRRVDHCQTASAGSVRPRGSKRRGFTPPATAAGNLCPGCESCVPKAPPWSRRGCRASTAAQARPGGRANTHVEPPSPSRPKPSARNVGSSSAAASQESTPSPTAPARWASPSARRSSRCSSSVTVVPGAGFSVVPPFAECSRRRRACGPCGAAVRGRQSSSARCAAPQAHRPSRPRNHRHRPTGPPTVKSSPPSTRWPTTRALRGPDRSGAARQDHCLKPVGDSPTDPRAALSERRGARSRRDSGQAQRANGAGDRESPSFAVRRSIHEDQAYCCLSSLPVPAAPWNRVSSPITLCRSPSIANFRSGFSRCLTLFLVDKPPPAPVASHWNGHWRQRGLHSGRGPSRLSGAGGGAVV